MVQHQGRGRRDHWWRQQVRLMTTAPDQSGGNRQARQREKALMRKMGDVLDTTLIECGTQLDGHKNERAYRGAIADVYYGSHGLKCIVCERAFATELPISAMLLACSRNRQNAACSASGICLHRWASDNYLELVDQAATRVLSRIVAGGKFLDPLPEQKETARASVMEGGP
jgi:hypothetical protein